MNNKYFMRSRDGHDIGLTLYDDTGRRKNLELFDMEMLLGYTSKNILKILGLAVSKKDFRLAYLAIIREFCMFFHITTDYSKLFRHYIFKILDFHPSSVIVNFNHKQAIFYCNPKELGLHPFISIDQVFLRNQYNINKKNIGGRIVVDCGAHLGVFSVMATMLGANKVYAFEPSKENYKILSKNIEKNHLNKKIVVINKGLADKSCKKKIYYDYAGDSSASFIKKNTKFSESVNVTTLDRYLQNKKVGFIKSDCEGYEDKLLNGSKVIIKNNKPILSFSAYHNPHDKETLPKILKSIRKDYNISLKHYHEEVFYCY